jgi:hypothetical protein
MKRLHVHITVADLNQGIHFYSKMFDAQPSKIKSDYAKWQLDDPMVNFAISTRSKKIGLDHLGVQVENQDELNRINERLLDAQIDTGKLDKTTCCYAKSVKAWSFDPAGIPWESFMTMQDAEVYGMDNAEVSSKSSACCSGAAPEQSSCC